ncbi:MAG: sugar transferase [Patescibacteria group bacterium]
MTKKPANMAGGAKRIRRSSIGRFYLKRKNTASFSLSTKTPEPANLGAMVRFGIRAKRLILVVGDFVVFEAALLVTLTVRYGSVTHSAWNAHALPFTLLALLWIMVFYIAGLYDLALARDSLRFLRTFLEAMLANLGVALGLFYLIPVFGIAPRTNLILDFVLVLLLGYAWRLAYNRLLAPTLFRNRVLFIGHTDDAARVHELLSRSALGFELIAVAETAPGTRFDDGSVTWHVSIDIISSILAEKNISTIVLGHKPDDVPGLRDALYQTLFTPVAILDRTSLEEILTGRVPLEHVSQTWFLEHLRESDKAWYEAVKRVVDIFVAIPVGIITLLLFPFITLAVRLSSPGPILYSQIRVGKYGKPFRIWKFRTMVATDPTGGAEAGGKPQFSSKDDPRITKIGKFLRAARLDELPQVWNVLRGDMSIIGPRPERPEFVQELTRQMPYYALRHLTRPGLTGWAQVRFPYASTFEDNLKKLQYDLYYIKHRSLMLDGAILLKTVGIVLRRQGT